MNELYQVLRLFGERYIYCDSEQAEIDVANREDMILAYSALMRICYNMIPKD